MRRDLGSSSANGELQEYVVHKGKPSGLSDTMWIWLCGRDSKLPQHGPDQLALKVAMQTAEQCDDLCPKTSLTRTLTEDHGLEIEKDRASRVNASDEWLSATLWDRMLKVERKRDKRLKKRHPSCKGRLAYVRRARTFIL
jgi:hypothetical protein